MMLNGFKYFLKYFYLRIVEELHFFFRLWLFSLRVSHIFRYNQKEFIMSVKGNNQARE